MNDERTTIEDYKENVEEKIMSMAIPFIWAMKFDSKSFLNEKEVKVLIAISKPNSPPPHKYWTLTDVQHEAGMGSNTISGVVYNSLVVKGLVLVRKNPKGKGRITIIELTDKGLKLMQLARTHIWETNKTLSVE